MQKLSCPKPPVYQSVPYTYYVSMYMAIYYQTIPKLSSPKLRHSYEVWLLFDFPLKIRIIDFAATIL